MKIRDWNQFFPRPLREVYDCFASVKNLRLWLPPGVQLKLHSEPHYPLTPGMLFDYDLVLYGIAIPWRTRIEEVSATHFVDSQERGPYRFFRHTHQFYEQPGGTLMLDRVEYDVAPWPLGALAERLYVDDALHEIFLHRRLRAAELFGCDSRLLSASE